MKENSAGLTFEEWLVQVDEILVNAIGLGHMDLSDFPSYDLWSEGCEPMEGVLSCLEYSDFPGDLLGMIEDGEW